MPVSIRSAKGLAAIAHTALAMTFVSSAAIAAPPSPSAAVTASCTNDAASGNYTQYVRLDVSAANKGRWVDFRVTVSVPGATNSPKSRAIAKHDSRTRWVDTFTFLTVGTQATSADVEVQVLGKKGEPVGSPASWNGACSPQAAG